MPDSVPGYAATRTLLQPRLGHQPLVAEPPPGDAGDHQQKDQDDAHAGPAAALRRPGIVLRDEIFRRTRHAVVIGPAIDDRHLLAPVAVRRRRCRRLPFEGCRAPRISARILAVAQAPEQVEQEYQLREADDQRGHADEGVERMHGVGNECRLAEFRVASRHTDQPDIVHGEEDQIGADEGDPEMELAHRLVEHPPGDFRVPVIDRTEHHHDRRHAHDHVEMRDDEHGVGQRHVDDHIAEKQPGQPTVDEGDDEGEREQHRDGQVDVAAPQRQHPVVDLYGGRDGDDQRRGGEEETEIRMHAADIHVVRPHDERERADADDRPHHHAVAEDVFPGMGADQIGHDAERRQRDDVDLGMPEEPEQVLEQDRAAAAIAELLAHLDQGRHEEAGSQHAVEQHHHRGDEQRREGEQGHDRGGENAPDGERHAHQRHAAGAALQHGHDIVQAAHGEADDEEDQRDEHQDDACLLATRRAAEDRLRRVERPAGAGRPAGRKEARHQHQHGKQVDPVGEHVDIGEHHVAGPHHERDQVVAETAQEQCRQQVDHHDHAVHGDELVIGFRRDEIECAGEAELQPHQPGQHERHEADRDGGAGILDGDDLGVLREDVGRPPTVRMIQIDVRDFRGRYRIDRARRDIDHHVTSCFRRGQRRPEPRHAKCAAMPPPRSSLDLVGQAHLLGCRQLCKGRLLLQPGLVVFGGVDHDDAAHEAMAGAA